MPSGDGEVVDDRPRLHRATARRGGAARLAAEQAALRRVATLVAGERPSRAGLPDRDRGGLPAARPPDGRAQRFEDARTSTIVGKFGEPTGDSSSAASSSSRSRARRCRCCKPALPARVEATTSLPGQAQPSCARLGVRAAASACRSRVAGVTWGALVAALGPDEPLPPETERRMQAFAELVALAVASAQRARRARRVAPPHRRGERRRAAPARAQPPRRRAAAARRAVASGCASHRTSSRDRSRGGRELLEEFAAGAGPGADRAARAGAGHPSGSAHRARTRAALEVLAARAPLMIELDVPLADRLPEPVETATYYVVSEALANVVKHAHADSAKVRVESHRPAGSRSRSPTTAPAAPTPTRLRPVRPARPGRDARRRAVDRELGRPGHGRARRASRALWQPRNRRAGRVTLTFFFSDIEDSSGLAGRLGGGYAARALEARELQRRAVERAGGREVDSRGDELFSVFDASRTGGRRRRTRDPAHFGRHAGRRRSACACDRPATAARRSGPMTVTSASTSTARLASARRRTAARCSAPRRLQPDVRSRTGAGARRLRVPRATRAANGSSSSSADDLPAEFPRAPQRPRTHEHAPLRAVIADDSPLLREGPRAAARGGRDRGRRAGPATRTS